MEMTQTLDGILFSRMINAGAANLKAHAAEVNQLNVFRFRTATQGTTCS